MEARALFLLAYAAEHGPVSVRQLYYAAEVHGLPGISKDDRDYDKVQRQVLALRRAGRMPYTQIADSTRWMRKPRSYNSVADALTETARFYRRSLWADRRERVEIWVEKDALAGVIYPITAEYDVPLMVTRGFSSETFAFEAASAWAQDGKAVFVYHMGDFDRSGVAAAQDLSKKLTTFAGEFGVRVFFQSLAVTPQQISEMGLPVRAPKRNSPADRAWSYSYACELDAIPPHVLREIVQNAIRGHVSDDALSVLKVAEDSERELLRQFSGWAA